MHCMQGAMGVSLLLALAGAAAAAAAGRPAHGPHSSDYVIVGGGTAGCVLAARLCEALPHAAITLLERGAPRSPATDATVLPMRLTSATWRDPSITEAFDSAPAAGVAGRSLGILTGATLGGSSSINAGLWSTPAMGEVDTWGFPGRSAAYGLP